MFIEEIVYLKRRWGLCNITWWVQINWDSSDSLYVYGDNGTCFDSFGVEHISREIKIKILRQIFTEYKHTVQITCRYPVLDLLILW